LGNAGSIGIIIITIYILKVLGIQIQIESK
jgi:hypothetical protein